MLPELYQSHLQKLLKPSEYLLLEILINLIQAIKEVNLEKLAASLPLPILFESRRRKIQRLLALEAWDVRRMWLSLIAKEIEKIIKPKKELYVVIDRTQWQNINILVISVIYKHRALPLYFELLDKKGNSNWQEQTSALAKVLRELKPYKIVVLGDREFCSVKLASWLREREVGFCLRLKKSHFIEQKESIWCQLKELGLKPGMSFYIQGITLTKSHQVTGFDLGAKWIKKWQGNPKEGWFILTNLGSLQKATQSYKKRFGIEEMFRDFKRGGYNLEGTKVTGKRLIALLICISMAYTISTVTGAKIKRTGQQKYVGRIKEQKRTFSRHSDFYIGLYGYAWLNFAFYLFDYITQLMDLSPYKRPFYQRGERAMMIIQSAF